MGQLTHFGISLFSIVTLVVITLNTLGSEGNGVGYTQRESKALEEVKEFFKPFKFLHFFQLHLNICKKREKYPLILDIVSAFGGKICVSGLPEIRWVLAPLYSRYELNLHGI